jgi:hypothetical protein
MFVLAFDQILVGAFPSLPDFQKHNYIYLFNEIEAMYTYLLHFNTSANAHAMKSMSHGPSDTRQIFYFVFLHKLIHVFLVDIKQPVRFGFFGCKPSHQHIRAHSDRGVTLCLIKDDIFQMSSKLGRRESTLAQNGSNVCVQLITADGFQVQSVRGNSIVQRSGHLKHAHKRKNELKILNN